MVDGPRNDEEHGSTACAPQERCPTASELLGRHGQGPHGDDIVEPLPQDITGTRRLTLMSFGFKYGHPPANYYFDVSFLKNPAREHGWDLFSSVSPRMREFVLAQPQCQRFLDAATPLLEVLLDCDGDMRVAIGCSAGRHRSAVVVEELARRMESDRVTVKVVHREEIYQ